MIDKYFYLKKIESKTNRRVDYKEGMSIFVMSKILEISRINLYLKCT